jgi:hypothetical protein
MKKLFPIALFFCLLIHGAIAQPVCCNLSVTHYFNDTLAYIQQSFIVQKDRYVGGSLSVLLKDFQIPLRSYLFGPSWNDRYHIWHLTLSFNSRNEMSRRIDRTSQRSDDRDAQPLLIHIEFAPKSGGEDPVPTDSVAYPPDIDAFIANLHNDAALFKLVFVASRDITLDRPGPPSGFLLRPASLDMATLKRRIQCCR